MSTIDFLKKRIIGQDEAVHKVAPYIDIYHAGLNPPGRPAANLLLLGLTGTGKTLTAEVVAELLHGDRKKIIKINCAEYAREHEIAKLIGSPPGYIGHKETKPAITQDKLKDVKSKDCMLSVVLFDEIEKGCASLDNILLSILDKGEFTQGDNTKVDFQDTIIFLTSNVGTKELLYHTNHMGFTPKEKVTDKKTITRITGNAAKNKFSPEFLNRIDSIITYDSLSEVNCKIIIGKELSMLNIHLLTRLGPNSAFIVHLNNDTYRYIISKCVSDDFGAREIKRILQFELMYILSSAYLSGEIEPRSEVMVSMSKDNKFSLKMTGLF